MSSEFAKYDLKTNLTKTLVQSVMPIRNNANIVVTAVAHPVVAGPRSAIGRAPDS